MAILLTLLFQMMYIFSYLHVICMIWAVTNKKAQPYSKHLYLRWRAGASCLFTAFHVWHLSSLLFWIYSIFTGSEQSPFLNLQHIYRVWAVSFFEFTAYLQCLSSLAPVLNLQHFCRVLFWIYRIFTGSYQASSLFKFTAYSQGPFLNWQDIYRVPFWINRMFTGF